MQDTLSLAGQPLLIQVMAGVGVGVGAIIAAFFGYRKRVDREPPGAAATVLASIPDMSAVRHLSDVCIELTAAVQSLERSVVDLTHHKRNHIENERELCMRLRDLREVMDRDGH